MMATKRRFALEAASEKEQLLTIKVSKKTVYAENCAVNALREYLKLKDSSIVLENLQQSDLDDVLANFFATLRKGNEYYKRNTYLSMRQSLNRYFKKIHGRNKYRYRK